MKVETYWKRGYGQELFLTGHFTEGEIIQLRKDGYRKFKPYFNKKNKKSKVRNKKIRIKKVIVTNKNGIQIDTRRAM